MIRTKNFEIKFLFYKFWLRKRVHEVNVSNYFIVFFNCTIPFNDRKTITVRNKQGSSEDVYTVEKCNFEVILERRRHFTQNGTRQKS